MKNQMKPRPFIVWVLIALHILLGINGVGGGGAFILAPDGSLMGMPLSFLDNSPFPDFLIPGIVLFISLGIFPLAVAFSIWALPAWRWPDRVNPFKQTHWSWAASIAVGVIAIVWIAVQVLIIPLSFLQILIFCWGVVILLLTLLPAARSYCSRNT